MRHRRLSLMEKDPNCHWCRRELRMQPIPKGRSHPEDYPTLDHIYGRETSISGMRPVPDGEKGKIVLSCRKCNNDRSARIQKENIEITRMKSGRFPRILTTNNK